MKRAILILLAVLAILLVWMRYSRPRSQERPSSVTTAAPPIHYDGERAQGNVTSTGNMTRLPASPAIAEVPASLAATGSAEMIEVYDYWAQDGSIRVSKAEHERKKSENTRRMEAAKKADIEMGLNGPLREREAQLRTNSSSLVAGMADETVRRLMGNPGAVRIDMPFWPDRSKNASGRYDDHYQTNGIIYRYSPRDGLPFDNRNGRGFEVLFARFDPTGKWLVKWEWEPQGFQFSTARLQWKKWDEYAQTANLTQPK